MKIIRYILFFVLGFVAGVALLASQAEKLIHLRIENDRALVSGYFFQDYLLKKQSAHSAAERCLSAYENAFLSEPVVPDSDYFVWFFLSDSIVPYQKQAYEKHVKDNARIMRKMDAQSSADD